MLDASDGHRPALQKEGFPMIFFHRLDSFCPTELGRVHPTFVQSPAVGIFKPSSGISTAGRRAVFSLAPLIGESFCSLRKRFLAERRISASLRPSKPQHPRTSRRVRPVRKPALPSVRLRASCFAWVWLQHGLPSHRATLRTRSHLDSSNYVSQRPH